MRRRLADDGAGEHDEDAIGQRADLVQLDRDQQDALALVAQRDETLVNELDGADVDAARRLADQQAGPSSNRRVCGDMLPGCLMTLTSR